MMNIRRVLVPVSFAPSSKKAFRMGARLADAFGATLYVLNVYKTLPRMFFSVGWTNYDKEMEAERSKTLEDLEFFVRSELGNLNLRHAAQEIEVVEGRNAVEAILHVAREKKVDLIVVGHHEESRLEHLLFGRNIDRLVDEAPCDIIVTRTELYGEVTGQQRAA